MLNGFDPLASRFLADLNRIQERSQRAERQISSGLRVEKGSDAPEQVSEILRLRSRVETNAQVQTNLARVEAQVNTSEAAMREAVAIVERARVLAAQTGSTGAPSRPTMAMEARQLHERLFAVSRSSAEGRYVFSGDGPNAPAYVLDSTQSNGVRFVGSSTTSSSFVADENQTTFRVFKTASELFDAPGADNAFKALNDLAVALEADSEAGVQTAMTAINTSLDHLNQQLAFYGNAQNRVTAASDATKRNGLALRANLSHLEETDLPAAILELNTAKLHHEAALRAHAQIPQSTLFDFLG